MLQKRKKTILVTGGGGYVGSAVTKYLLQKGYVVRVLDLFIYGKEPLLSLGKSENLEICKGDIRDEKIVSTCLKGVDMVLHMAAIVGAPESERIPALTWEINLDATKRLVALSKKALVDRFIFVSTCSNYGLIRSGRYADENSELKPISPYAESKVAAEKFVLASTGKDFSPVVCRLATVYGVSPRMRFDLLVNQFTRDAYFRNELVVFGNQGRTFVHMFDVAETFDLLIAAPLRKVKDQVYNVGNTKDSNRTKFELAKIVERIIPGTRVSLIEKDLDARDYRVNFDKLSNCLGYKTKYRIEDGVKQLVEYFIMNATVDPYDKKYTNLEKYLDLAKGL